MPTADWLTAYQEDKELTLSPVDLNTYFEQEEIAGRRLTVINIGPCDLPSGKVLVRDPLVELGLRGEQPYFQTAPAGSYETELCVILPEDTQRECARYAAARLRFSDKRPVRFLLALFGDEDLSELTGEGDFFGFSVDAGMGCICDQIVHQAFCDWSDRWDKEHPGENQYDDYFTSLFEESYKAHPEYQREGGDWINFQVPGTQYHIPFFQSGFGDGVYPVYWGVDEEDHICQLVVHFIDIALAYSDEDDQ